MSSSNILANIYILINISNSFVVDDKRSFNRSRDESSDECKDCGYRRYGQELDR